MSRMSGADLPSALPITYRQQYRRCGKAGCARCAAGQPGHGPYWYAYWWEGGRRRSRCLGTQAPGAVAAAAGAAAAGAAAVAAPAPPPGAALRVRTLGAFAVWRGDTLIAAEQWTSRRAAGLFKCLLSTAGHRLLREQAIEWLWPEADPAAGAHNLRTAVHLLRRILDGPESSARHPRTGASHLRTEGDLLVLAPAGDAAPPPDWLDATAFAHAADAALAGQEMAACRAALARYGGDYLPDDPYAEWAAPVREALRRQYLAVLLHLAALSGAQGVLEEAETCLRRVLAAEPSHEEAAATLMGLLAASERRGEALRVYQALATALEEDLDATPSAALAALRARLLAQEAAPLAGQRPPPRDQPARPTNLPVALTSFVGRTHEVGAIQDAFTANRLVTLTGPGGCGKTRLALAVADRLVDTAAYPDGVWLVELAGLADPVLLPQAVAAALGVGEQAGQPLRETLVAFLRPRHLLLVLDNCEHLIAACTQLATYILQACPHLRVLATSRACLAIAGEQTYLVPSLAVPDPARLPPLAQLGRYEAVQLFLERARARRPELALTAANAEPVARICARLDGLPLALELAAARVSALSVAAIAARLEDRFRLLTGGPRTALPRQQTLCATMDWSYSLLGVSERALFRRLSVFVGGWTLAAAEMVCADAELPAPTVLDLLGRLLDQSLVVVDGNGGAGKGEIRYRFLETIRQYAAEKLVESGEREALRRAHGAWAVALARGEDRGERAERGTDIERLLADYDNLRAALAWSLEQQDDGVAALHLTTALCDLWAQYYHGVEGRQWLERALAHAPPTVTPERAEALSAAGLLAWHQADRAAARAWYHAALAAWRDLGDRDGERRILMLLGQPGMDPDDQAVAYALVAAAVTSGSPLPAWLAGLWSDHRAPQRSAESDRRALVGAFQFLSEIDRVRGDYAAARVWLERSVALLRADGRTYRLLLCLCSLCATLALLGEWAAAEVRLAEARALLPQIADPTQRAWALHRVAWVAWLYGDYATAGGDWEALLAHVRAHGDLHTERILWTLMHLGDVAWQQGDLHAARARYEESLGLAQRLGQPLGLANLLLRLGRLALAEGNVARAEQLAAQSLAQARALDAGWHVANALALQAEAALARGDPAGAGTSYCASVRHLRASGARDDAGEIQLRCLDGAAAVAAHLAGPDPAQGFSAVRLCGAATALRRALWAARAPADEAVHAQTLTAMRATLGEEAFGMAWAAGQALSLEQAIADALAEPAAAHDAALHRPPTRCGAEPQAAARHRLARAERLTWAMEHLRTVGPLSPRAYMAALDVERRTAVRDLRALEASGLVAVQGSTTDRRYVLQRDSL